MTDDPMTSGGPFGPRPAADVSRAAEAATPRSDHALERFWETLRRLPRYIALGVGLARDDRLPASVRATVLVGGAYAVSPVDLVPGIIPVAGQLDDLVVVLLTLRRAIRAAPPAIASEHMRRAGVDASDLDTDLAACRTTAVWLTRQGLRLGGRFVTGAGRRLLSAIDQRRGGGERAASAPRMPNDR